MKNKIITKTVSGVLLCTMLAYTMPVFAVTKDETVYSKLDAYGSSYSNIVNAHIINDEEAELINDLSNLVNIVNVGGDESFDKNDNSIIWKAEGKDIYYQGESKEELPIKCSIKYELDGEEKTKEEIIGKSGKVKITIKYENTDKHIVNINGKQEKLYTPFIVACGTIIDDGANKNITITNGKVINDGTKTFALAIALPGLQDSLGIREEIVTIPDTIELTMDTTNFEMNNIITFATPKISDKEDLNIAKTVDKLYGKVDELQSAGVMLEEGANTLKNGTDEYSKKSKEFNSAMKSVTSGVNTINSNYSEISKGIELLNGASSQVLNGITKVTQSMDVISKNINDLKNLGALVYSSQSQAKQVVDNAINNMSGITTNDNLAKIEAIRGKISDNNSAIQKLNSSNASLEQLKLGLSDASQIAIIDEQIRTNNETIKNLNENISEENSMISILNSTDTSKTLELKKNLQEISDNMEKLQGTTKVLTDGLIAVNDGVTELNSKSGDIIAGAKAINEGILKLSKGSKAVQGGLNMIDTSATKLLEANNSLTSGAETINEGANTLAEGISTFNKEGIGKICNYLNGNVKNIAVRVEKLEELSEEYKNFTMLNEKANGKVKFIMIVDGIHKEEEDNNE